MKFLPVRLYDDHTPAYAFDYPRGDEIFEFDHEGSTLTRVVHLVDGNEFRYNVEPWPGASCAREAANAAFRQAHPAFQAENVPPFRQPLADAEAWRCRFRLVDGLSAPLVCDLTFIDAPGGVLRVDYLSAPSSFAVGLPALEMLLATFRMGGEALSGV